MENNHTKGEWAVSHYTYDFGIYSLDNDYGSDIAIVRDKGGEGKANARLIVKAVNNHEKLVNALQNLVNLSYDTARPTKAEKHYNLDTAIELLKSIEQQ